MSYGLFFWIGEISDDDETAFADCSVESERDFANEPQPHPRFVELADKLLARYPCLTTSVDTVWASGPLIDNFGARVGGVDVRSRDLEEVVPFVVESAAELEISVLDPQALQVYRPKDALSGAADSAARVGPRARQHVAAVSGAFGQTSTLLHAADRRAALAEAIGAVLMPLEVRRQPCDAREPSAGHCEVDDVDRVCVNCWGTVGAQSIGADATASITDLTNRLDDAALDEFIHLVEMQVSRPEQVSPVEGTVSALDPKEGTIVLDTAFGPFPYTLRGGPDRTVAVAVGDKVKEGTTLIPGEFDPQHRLEVFGANYVIDALAHRAASLVGGAPARALARLCVPLVGGFCRIHDPEGTTFEKRAVVSRRLAFAVAEACMAEGAMPPRLDPCVVPLSFAAQALIDARRPLDAATFVQKEAW